MKTDALARGLRNKAHKVRNFIHDLDDDLSADKGAAASLEGVEDKLKPKKKLFGLFK
ncbi:hypothetical protein DFAR_1440002 [Desulfarculales bacterium]